MIQLSQTAHNNDTGEYITVSNITNCSRCNGIHHNLSFKRAYLTPEEAPGEWAWTHWALCPTTGDPILMIVVTTKPVTSTEDTEKDNEESPTAIAGIS